MEARVFIINRVWERKGWVGKVLWPMLVPVSFLYAAGVGIRNLLYSAGWLASKSLPCAVVSVGNLTVGGTGKTPTAIWLAGELAKLGYQAVILSRGYRRRRALFGRAAPDDPAGPSGAEIHDPRSVGDEPAMMARMFGHKVAVGKRRYETAGEFLTKGRADVFILDDGFQHRRLKRDLDILILGSDSSGWLMPAGPFREPRDALRRADVLLVTGARDRWEPLIRRAGKEGRTFEGRLQPQTLVTIEGERVVERPLEGLIGKKIVAVSAIANPRGFYRMIHRCEGEIVDAIEFPDHYEYSTEDWRRINYESRRGDLIVTTEKDLVKLRVFPFPRDGLFALRVAMVVEQQASLVQIVRAAVEKKAAGSMEAREIRR
jgi:tetraacyldisaccharide 4'-kinase